MLLERQNNDVHMLNLSHGVWLVGPSGLGGVQSSGLTEIVFTLHKL